MYKQKSKPELKDKHIQAMAKNEHPESFFFKSSKIIKGKPNYYLFSNN